MQIRSLLERLEWISLIYLALFVMAVLSPSLVTRGYFGIDERHVEEVMIFIFGLVGLATFSLYQRLMEGKEKEHQSAKNEYERARRELVESYQYIGSINRQIELLKRLANQTSLQIVASESLDKELLASLLGSAAASVNAKRAYIRYLELDRLRTVSEIAHVMEKEAIPLKIANKDLKKLHDTGASHAFMRSEDGCEVLVVPSDHKGRRVKAYLLIVMDSENARHCDTSLLKVFANQAELLHYTLKENVKQPANALQLVEQAEKQAVGEVR